MMGCPFISFNITLADVKEAWSIAFEKVITTSLVGDTFVSLLAGFTPIIR
jgi:hypothetical protein